MRTFLALILVGGCASKPTVPDGPSNALVAARPYDTNIPRSYDPGKPTPLVILLHGFDATAFLEEAGIFGLTAVSESKGFLYAMPNGTRDAHNRAFWNATDACCDQGHIGVDDVAYLNAVIDDMEAHYNVDKKRVFVTGHSNGGFMSHRLACDSAPRIAAIVSLAGAVWLDPNKCQPADKPAVLEVHGDADTEVPYQGTAIEPSAPATVAFWAMKNGCSPTLSPSGAPLDLVSDLPGAETRLEAHTGCVGGAAELWTIQGGSHVPVFNMPAWGETIFAWMMAHPKS